MGQIFEYNRQRTNTQLYPYTNRTELILRTRREPYCDLLSDTRDILRIALNCQSLFSFSLYLRHPFSLPQHPPPLFSLETAFYFRARSTRRERLDAALFARERGFIFDRFSASFIVYIPSALFFTLSPLSLSLSLLPARQTTRRQSHSS